LNIYSAKIGIFISRKPTRDVGKKAYN